MKILLVHNKYQQPGGEDEVFSREAALLRSKGHRVGEFVRRNSDIQERGLFTSAQLAIRTIWSGETVRDLTKALACENPDVVHLHNTFPLISPSAYYACRECGVPVVQTVHNYRLFCPAATFFRQGKICEDCEKRSLWQSVRHSCYRGSRSASAVAAAMLMIHRALNTWRDLVECFIVPADFVRGKLTEMGIPPQKIRVKPNFLAVDPGTRMRAGDYALFVGRLSPEKGVATLVNAWGRVSTNLPLRIIGDGPLRAKLERIAASYDVRNIRFEGWADHESVIDAIKGARFLFFPSESYETFGMVAVEAFACGIPVIASRLGVMAEIVDDHRTGLHFTPGDPADLAAKAQWAFDHPSELSQMGCNARAEYQARYTAELNYRQLIEIYRSVVGPTEASHASHFRSAEGGQDAIQTRREAQLS